MVPVENGSVWGIRFEFIPPLKVALQDRPEDSPATLDEKVYTRRIHVVAGTNVNGITSREVNNGLVRGYKFPGQEQVGDHALIAVGGSEGDCFLLPVWVTLVSRFDSRVECGPVVGIQSAVNPENLLRDRLLLFVIAVGRRHQFAGCLLNSVLG